MVWFLWIPSVLVNRPLFRLNVKPTTWLLAYLQAKTFFSICCGALLPLRVVNVWIDDVRHGRDWRLWFDCFFVFAEVILFQFSEFWNFNVLAHFLDWLFSYEGCVLCSCAVNCLVEETPQGWRLFLIPTMHADICPIEIFRHHTRILAAFLLLFKQ